MIYRILTSISCIATLMVAVFSLIRCKAFWRDFRQFFIGMWKFISGTAIGLNWYIGTRLVIMLAVFEFYAEYIHKIWKYNLMGSWILLVIGVTMISAWWHHRNPRYI